MVLIKNIELLLEKYENGETTIKEEQQLKHYFTQETVAPHLEVYKPLFAYFSHAQHEQFTKDVPLKTKKTYSMYRWISVAAVAVVMLSLYFSGSFEPAPKTLATLTAEEQRDYQLAMEAFNLLSSNFKKGTDQFTAVTQLSETLNQGQETLAHLTEFDQATDRIFKYE